MSKPVRIELSRAELFEAAFFIGYAVARLDQDKHGDLHARAQRILDVLISADAIEETARDQGATITVEAIGVEPKPAGV